MRNISVALAAHLSTLTQSTLTAMQTIPTQNTSLTLSYESARGQMSAMLINSAMAASMVRRAEYALLHGVPWSPLPEYGALLATDESGNDVALEVLDVQELHTVALTVSRRAGTVVGKVRLSDSERARVEALLS